MRYYLSDLQVQKATRTIDLPVNLIYSCQVEGHQPHDLNLLQLRMGKNALPVEPEHTSSRKVDQVISFITSPISLHQVRVFGCNCEDQVQDGTPVVSSIDTFPIGEHLVLVNEGRLTKYWERGMDSVEVGLEELVGNVLRRQLKRIHLIGHDDRHIIAMVGSIAR